MFWGWRKFRNHHNLIIRGDCCFKGAIHIHLGVEVDCLPVLKAHSALIVEGLVSCAHQAGANVRWDECVPETKWIFCTDPFGNRSEFVE